MPVTSLYALPELDGSVSAEDLDGDLLHNLAESVVGTDPMNPDTDGDGIEDGVEVDFGLNPLDGLLLNLGVVFQVNTVDAQDVDVDDQHIVLSHGTYGITLFNAFNGMDPRIMAQVNTPGQALDAALAGDLIAVADGSSGVTLIDISDPAAAAIIQSIPLGGSAQAIDAMLDLAYVGLDVNMLAVVDVRSGSVIGRLNMPYPVVDVVAGTEAVYVAHVDRISVVDKLGASLLFTTPALGTPSITHLALGKGTLFAMHGSGYATLDLTDPIMPTLVSNAHSGQFWRDMALNGSGLGVAGVNSLGGGGIEVYDVSNPAQTITPAQESFVFAARVRAVEITNGLAYCASDSGLLVVNYLAYDAMGVAPVIALDGPLAKGAWMLEEGSASYISADVMDDVQVRHVKFYRDGELVHTDASYPFTYSFQAPLLSQQASMEIQAKAIDTGGNSGWSATQLIDLTADVTAPQVMSNLPVIGQRTVNLISAFMSESLSAATVNPASFLVVEAGPDGLFDTGDDVVVNPFKVQFDSGVNRVDFVTSGPLSDGSYRATLTTAITDQVGNPLPADHRWVFRVADAVFWIAGSGDFQAGLNWSDGMVPGPSDHVIIDAPGTPTITLATAPARTVGSMEVHDALVLQGGDLTTSVLDIYGSVDIQNGRISQAELNNTFGGSLIVGTTGVGSYSAVLNNVTLNGALNNSGRQTSITGSFFLNGDMWLSGTGMVMNGPLIDGTGTIHLSSTYITTNIGTYTIGAGISVVGQQANMQGTPVNYGTITMNGGTQCTIYNLQNHNQLTVQNTACTLSGGQNHANVQAQDAALTLAGTFENLGDMDFVNTHVRMGMSGPYQPSQLGNYTRSGTTRIEILGHMDVNPGLLLDANTGSWELSGSVDAVVSNGFIETQDGAQLILLQMPDNDPATLRNIELRTDITLGFKTMLKFDSGLTLNNATITVAGNVAYLQGARFACGAAGLQTVDGVGLIQVTTSGGNDVFYGSSSNQIRIGPGITVVVNGGNVGSYTHLINQGLIEKNGGSGELVLRGEYGFTNEGTIRQTLGPMRAKEPISNSGLIDILAGQNLVLDKNLTCNSSSTLQTSIASLSSYGRFTGHVTNSAVTLDGTLAIQLEGGYVPNLGDTFTLMTASSITGSFASITHASLGNGTQFQVTVNAASVVLEVVPE